MVMIIHKNYPYLDTSFNLIALDVGQGDSLFLKYPNNKGNILIDTGGIITYEKENWQKNHRYLSCGDCLLCRFGNDFRYI
jgi:competence protein ComEC